MHATFRPVILALLALALAGAGLGTWTGYQAAPDPNPRADCTYAALQALPTLHLKNGEQVYDRVKECQHMGTDDKNAIRSTLARAFSTAITR